MNGSGSFVGLMFLSSLAIAALYLLRLEWVRRQSRFGRPSKATVIGTVAWAIAWSFAYTWVGLWSVTALGALLLAIYVASEFMSFGKEESSWGTPQQIMDGALASTMIVAPAVFTILMLKGGG